MPNPVVHFEITGRDGAQLQSFYEGAFGWTIDAGNPMQFGMVRNGGHGIDGGISGDQPGVTVYIEVPDLEATLAEVQRRGGTVVMGVTEIPGMVTMAKFADPDGNVVGLIKSQ